MDESGAWHGDEGIETIFHQALKLGPDERAPYLDRACGDDPALRERVEKLLGAEQHAGGFMRDPAAPDPQDAAEGPGDTIGPYKLLQVIGEGGMGTVYMADQTEPVQRRVALKIVKPGMDSGEVVARFEAERQALALMDHHGIAKVFDAGETQSGRPYFAMELVKGISITEYCDQHRLKPRERLELFVQVCRAVHHAHQKGVIHRDIKPANVLVADYDDKAVPKVIDFGVAKATGPQLTEKTMFTQFGQILGTFEYMSPEQAKLNQLDVDTRADIYSLGVLLYELLTGTTPFDRGRLQVVGFEELLRIIREEEPPKPSTRISTLGERTETVAASRGGDARQLRRSLSGDLDWIVMRAMDKDRNRRYESAASLADDIERFLADAPVHACPPSTAYRMKKFVRRHRGQVTAAGALVLVLILGLVGTSYGFVRANEARERAVGVNFRMGFDRGLRLCEDGHVGHGMLWLARALELCPDDAPDMERVVRANLSAWRRELNALEMVFPHEAPVIAVAFSPDGKWLATGGEDFIAQVWDLRTGKPVGEPMRHRGDVHELEFSADGTLLLSADYRRTAFLWDPRSGKRIHTLDHAAGASPRELVVLTATGGVLGAAFRPPHDAQLVTSCGDGTIMIWDTRTGEKTQAQLPKTAHRHMVHDVAVSADGKRILTGSHDSTAKLWDFDSCTLLATFKHDTQVVTADFRGNDQIVTGDAAGNVLLWSIKDALAAKDHIARFSTEDYLARWRHRGTVHRLRVNRDGTLIFSGSFDNTARLWNPDGDGAAVGAAFEHQAAVWAVAFAHDGERVATACDDNVARVWRPAPGQSVRIVHHEISFDHSAVASPGGRFMLVKTDDETAVVHDVVNKARLCTLRHKGGIRAFAVSPDLRHVLTGGTDGSCRVWDVAKGAPAFDAYQHGNGVWSVDISADGLLGVSGAFDGSVVVRDLRTGAVRRIPVAFRVQGVAFSPDSTRLFVGGSDKRGHVFSLKTGNQLLLMEGHLSAVFSPSFSRDGDRIVTASHDNTARVWDAATGEPISAPMRHPGPLSWSVGTAFSPDGKTIAATCDDGSVRVWDVATSRPIGPALRLRNRVLGVSFGSDTEIRTATPDGTSFFWEAERSPIRGDVERIKLWVEVITGFELDEEGALRALDAPTWSKRRARLRSLGGAPRAMGGR